MLRGTLDIIYGIVLLAIAGILLWETTKPQYANVIGLGFATDPAFYPRILLGLWALLALLLLIHGFVARRREVQPQNWGGLAVMVALTAVYAWLIMVIGFLFASVLLCTATPLILGYRNLAVTLVIAVAFPVALWYAFVFILKIALPVSPWFTRI